MSIINAKENRAITADSRRMEPLLNGFLMLIVEIKFLLQDLLERAILIMELIVMIFYI